MGSGRQALTAAIWLVRHGRPAVAPGICYGRLDVAAEIDPLLAHRLGRIACTTIWTSPSERCHELADAIAAIRRRRAIADPRLMELDFGVWEGRAWNDISRAEIDPWARALLGRPAPLAESGAALIARVRGFACNLQRRPGRHIVVAHAGPLTVLEAILTHRPIDLAAPRLGFSAVIPVRTRMPQAVLAS